MALYVTSGTYTGDGTDNRNISTSESFPIKFLWLHATTAQSNNAGGGIWSITPATDLAGPNYQNDTAQSNIIQSLGTGTFQVGSGATNYNANRSSVVYYYMALGGDDADIKLGSYTGNATDNRAITGVGFQPLAVFIMGTGNNIKVARFANTGDTSHLLANSADSANLIQSLDSDGFTIGTESPVNTNSQTYYYVAIRSIPGQVSTGTYTGNASDNRSITGLGLNPEAMILKGANNAFPVWRSLQNVGDSTSPTQYNVANFANGIQSFITDGFTVGTGGTVNTNSVVYHYLAFATAPVATSVPDLRLAFI